MMFRSVFYAISVLFVLLLLLAFFTLFGCDNSHSQLRESTTESTEPNSLLAKHRELDALALSYWQYRERYLNLAWHNYLKHAISVHTYEDIVLCVIQDYDRKMALVKHDRKVLTLSSQQ